MELYFENYELKKISNLIELSEFLGVGKPGSGM